MSGFSGLKSVAWHYRKNKRLIFKEIKDERLFWWHHHEGKD
jgi:hypothetical protein